MCKHQFADETDTDHILFCRQKQVPTANTLPARLCPNTSLIQRSGRCGTPAPNPGQPNVQDKSRKINSMGKLPLQALELTQILPLTVQ